MKKNKLWKIARNLAIPATVSALGCVPTGYRWDLIDTKFIPSASEAQVEKDASIRIGEIRSDLEEKVLKVPVHATVTEKRNVPYHEIQIMRQKRTFTYPGGTTWKGLGYGALCVLGGLALDQAVAFEFNGEEKDNVFLIGGSIFALLPIAGHFEMVDDYSYTGKQKEQRSGSNLDWRWEGPKTVLDNKPMSGITVKADPEDGVEIASRTATTDRYGYATFHMSIDAPYWASSDERLETMIASDAKDMIKDPAARKLFMQTAIKGFDEERYHVEFDARLKGDSDEETVYFRCSQLSEKALDYAIRTVVERHINNRIVSFPISVLNKHGNRASNVKVSVVPGSPVPSLVSEEMFRKDFAKTAKGHIDRYLYSSGDYRTRNGEVNVPLLKGYPVKITVAPFTQQEDVRNISSPTDGGITVRME
ncbi:hypothetical protein GF351_06425 [Candidatus Woesearchaeota archaeon]|nr:hypothetical protein [Candidatus Woesearchaeota archaeon]